MLRRYKADVEASLTQKIEMVEFAKMSEQQIKLYKDVLHKNFEIIKGSSHSISRHGHKIKNIIMHLRKCANHPLLLGEHINIERTDMNALIENCGKMKFLNQLLKELKKSESRVLIFCQMTRMLKILRQYCEWSGYKYCYLDGKTSSSE